VVSGVRNSQILALGDLQAQFLGGIWSGADATISGDTSHFRDQRGYTRARG